MATAHGTPFNPDKALRHTYLMNFALEDQALLTKLTGRALVLTREAAVYPKTDQSPLLEHLDAALQDLQDLQALLAYIASSPEHDEGDLPSSRLKVAADEVASALAGPLARLAEALQAAT